MIKLEVTISQLQQSLQLLTQSSDKERVLLWLGKKEQNNYSVREVFLPLQITEEDSFFIPAEGMDKIMGKLRIDRLMMVAQIHTHPFEAYHSESDDTWAIVRHINAYSLVLPYFCRTTTISNFHENVVTYVLNNQNLWQEASNQNLIIR